MNSVAVVGNSLACEARRILDWNGIKVPMA